MDSVSMWGIALFIYFGFSLNYLAWGNDIPAWTWPVLIALILSGVSVVLWGLYYVGLVILTILGA